MDIKGKVAIVTGAADGIGKAYVEALLHNGANVVINDLDADKGEKTLKQLTAKFGPKRVLFLKGDVTKDADFENLFKNTIANFGGIDILVNNAGILDDHRWKLEIELDLTAVACGTLLAFNQMAKNKGGKGGVVVNIASILGLQEFTGAPVYAAVKHGVVGLSRSFGTSYHYDRSGIRVLTLCPGVTDTTLISEAHNRQYNDEWSKIAAADLAALPAQKPEHVAQALIHLVKEAATGSVWVAEGGEPVYEVKIPDRLTLKVK